MTNRQLTYPRNKLSKWLLMIALLLSFLANPAAAGNSQSRLQQRTQTELVFSNAQKTAKRSVSYKNSFPPASTINGFINSGKNKTRTLLTYTRLIKVKFDRIAKQFLASRTAGRFIPIRRIPQISKEDVYISITG